MIPLRESTKIVCTVIGAMIVFWALLYQLTIRMCPDSFTYPPVFTVQSPTGLAACWGNMIGVGFGLLVGIGFVWAEESPRLSRLVKPLGLLLIVMAIAALLGGIVGYLATSLGFGSLSLFDQIRVPEPRRRNFLVNDWIHETAGWLGLVSAGFFFWWRGHVRFFRWLTTQRVVGIIAGQPFAKRLASRQAFKRIVGEEFSAWFAEYGTQPDDQGGQKSKRNSKQRKSRQRAGK